MFMNVFEFRNLQISEDKKEKRKSFLRSLIKSVNTGANGTQNYIVKKGVDGEDLMQKLLKYYDSRGAEYPAEHNVGHEYFAKPALSDFYKDLDPTNSFNPGIGKTSKKKSWS